MQSFETVWQTINEKHFDPTFSGLDWSEVHDRYQSQIKAAQSEEEYYLLGDFFQRHNIEIIGNKYENPEI